MQIFHSQLNFQGQTEDSRRYKLFFVIPKINNSTDLHMQHTACFKEFKKFFPQSSSAKRISALKRILFVLFVEYKACFN